jgi:hypothetical protein
MYIRTTWSVAFPPFFDRDLVHQNPYQWTTIEQ